MAVPSTITFSAAAKVAAHTALRDTIDGSATAGLLRIRDAADVLLVEFTLADPCGTVNGTTGQLTLTLPASVNAVASGTAAYGEICDGDGVAHLSMPAVAGDTAVANKFVINSLAIVSGGPTSVFSATIG